MVTIRSPKPTYTKFDVKDLVERLEPNKTRKKNSYVFSNGRSFREKD